MVAMFKQSITTNVIEFSFHFKGTGYLTVFSDDCRKAYAIAHRSYRLIRRILDEVTFHRVIRISWYQHRGDTFPERQELLIRFSLSSGRGIWSVKYPSGYTSKFSNDGRVVTRLHNIVVKIPIHALHMRIDVATYQVPPNFADIPF